MDRRRRAARPTLGPLPFKGKGRGTDSCRSRDAGQAGAAALLTSELLALSSASGLCAGTACREGDSLALGLAGLARAPAQIGWRGFRGSPALQLKRSGCARRHTELPAGGELGHSAASVPAVCPRASA
ncbi:hypothetical protein P7K49_030802 [Saguinus oedipus]|uniref:Uncharacterized protein n=1 Tax=Saguinus oedipus TaxID=9490 RepID=A0ABQ9U379_SAGOE|nr:hypothetical protein P7K49_030802 [Saguinus oedipus]